MHKIFIYFLLVTAALISEAMMNTTPPLKTNFSWNTIAPIPDKFGFAGSFAGVSNGVMLVAGGANFPDGGAPWTGSTKVWHDAIFALSSINGSWKQIGKLPIPLGYGISISWHQKLVCFGGSNAAGHHDISFMLEYKDGVILTHYLPVLPLSLANACGTVINNTFYLAGGLEKSDSKTASNQFWSIDLSATKPSWKKLPTWPGESRMLSIAGSQENCFYLFGGTTLIDGNRRYLNNAFKYDPKKGWTKIADLPQPIAAAPSPAYNRSPNQLFIFGGDDGTLAAKASVLKEKHPGFSKQILSYDVFANKWSSAGEILTSQKQDAESNPNASIWAPVTSPLVIWDKKIVFAGGEVRPAVRTPNVLVATPLQ